MPRFNFDAWLADPRSAVAIVGATGWVGQAMLHAVLETGSDLTPERLRLFTRTPRPLTMAGRAFQTEALGPSASLGEGRWLVAHAGVIGGDARAQNDALLEDVLRLSADADVERLVQVSSGAAGFGDEAPPAKAAYARMKREHELRALDWSAATAASLLIPRIFNLGGPYMTCVDNYALGDFIQRLSRDGALAIAAPDPVVRTYVHVLEMARTILDMAVDETEDGAPFDVAGGEVVELGDLAHAVASALGLRNAAITRPPPTGGAGDRYVGDGRRYQAALANRGLTPAPLSVIVADTIADLKSRPR